MDDFPSPFPLSADTSASLLFFSLDFFRGMWKSRVGVFLLLILFHGWIELPFASFFSVLNVGN